MDWLNRLKQTIEIPPVVDNKSFTAKNIKPEAKYPITEGRRKTLEMVADAILTQAVIDIEHGGIWQSGPDTEALEDEIKSPLPIIDGWLKYPGGV